MTEIHRCPLGGANNQERDLAISTVPRTLRFVDHLRCRANLNSISHNRLGPDTVSPLEVGWYPPGQRTRLQNRDIPDCHSNQQSQPRSRAPQTLIHSPDGEALKHTHKNLVRSVHTIFSIHVLSHEKISTIEPKIPDLHFHCQRKHHELQIYQVD